MADTPDLGFNNCGGLTCNALACNGLAEGDFKILGLLWPVLAPFSVALYTKKYTKALSDQKSGVSTGQRLQVLQPFN